MCECIKTVDATLAADGNWVEVNTVLPGFGGETVARAIISTVKRPGGRTDGKRGKKLPTVVADFCPFCGVRYYPEPPESEGANV